MTDAISNGTLRKAYDKSCLRNTPIRTAMKQEASDGDGF